MNQGKKIWLVISIIILVLGGISLYSLNKIPEIPISELNTTSTPYDTIQNIHQSIEHTTYSIKSEYPSFSLENIDTVIVSFIEKEHQQFLSTISNTDLTEKSSLTIKYEINTNDDLIKNILFSIESSINNVLTNRSEIFIVSEEKKQLVSIEDFIIIDKLTTSTLTTLIDKQLITTDLLISEINQAIKSDTLFTNSYITDDQLHLSLDVNTVKKEMILPLSAIIFALKEPYYSILSEQVKPLIEYPVVPKKKVALTFDDGPHPEFTKLILKSLNKYNVKATFYMLGKEANSYPLVAKQVVDEGHEIGNHTWFHENLTTLSISQAIDNIQRTNEKLFEITGSYPTTYRPPYGAINNSIINAIPMPMVKWTIDPKDWKYRDIDLIMDVIRTHLKEDSIILLHDIQGATAKSIDTIIEYIISQGYQLVTVSELLQVEKEEK